MTSSTRQQLIAAFVIFIILLSSVSANFPAKLEPKIILNVTESGNYSIFIGLENSEDTNPLLQDVHGLKKINGRFYVHSRSFIFLLNTLKIPVSKLSSLYYTQAFNWTIENERYNTCKTIISRTVRQCQSHVMSLDQLREPKTNELTNVVAACSTFGYFPKLQNFRLEKDGKITLSGKPEEAKLFCPYAPDHKMTAISTSGYIYTAFRKFVGETKSGIVKRQAFEKYETLYGSSPSTTNFNDNSDFIKTIETDDKILIFFNEIAIEERDYRKLPRVAQACKNDFGHHNFFFTSLFKARLNCSLSGASPLYFDELRSVSDVITMTSKDGKVTEVVMVVMQIPHDTIRASAICVFALEDIEKALLSPVFIQSERNPDSWIVPRTNKHPNLASCSNKLGSDGTRNLTEDESVFSQMHSLVSESVKSRDAGSNFQDLLLSTPLLITHGLHDALTTIATDDEFVSTNDSKILSHLVILVGTENGDVIKTMLLTSSHRLVTLERRQIFNEEKCGKDSDRSVQSILLDKTSGNMFVNFVNCIIVLPLCPFNTNCEKECIESRDPYCRWNGKRCVTVMPDDVDREQDLDSSDPTRLEECKVFVPVTLKEEIIDSTTSKPEDKVQLAAIGSSEASQVILALCGGVLLGILISSIIFYCCNPCYRIKQKNPLKPGVSRVNNNRHDSETSVTTKRSKYPSESSNNHALNNRISLAHDDVTVDSANRKRHVTETSTNSDASEGRKPQSQNNSAKTPDTPNQNFAGELEKRRIRKTSMSSARAPTKPSTSSNQESDTSQLLEINNEVFHRQGSSDSGERQKLLVETPSGVSNQFPGFIASDARQIRGPFPNGQPLLRTASFGPGIPPKGRQIGRQLSFQAPTRPRDLILSNGSPMKQQWISKTPMPPPTSSMITKGMTYSLDRRKMKPHLMTPTGHLMTPSSGERDYASHKRQRYASESQHQAYNHGTILSYPIIEESGFFHDPAANRALREGLAIDLRPDRRRVYVQASPAVTPVYDDRNSLRKNPLERRSSGFQPPIKHVTPVQTPVDPDPPKIFDSIPMEDLRTPSIPDRKSVHSSTSSSVPESSEALSSPDEEKELNGYLHPTEIVA